MSTRTYTPFPDPTLFRSPIRMAANEAAAPIVTRPTAPSAVQSPSTRPAATPTRTEADYAASATPSVIGGEDSIPARIIAGTNIPETELGAAAPAPGEAGPARVPATVSAHAIRRAYSRGRVGRDG